MMTRQVFLPLRFYNSEELYNEEKWQCRNLVFTPATDEDIEEWYPLIYPEGFITPWQFTRPYDHATMLLEYYNDATYYLVDACDGSEVDITATVLDSMFSTVVRDDGGSMWEYITFTGLTGFATVEGTSYRIKVELATSGQTYYSEKWMTLDIDDAESNYRIPDLTGNIRSSNKVVPDLRIWQ